MSLELIISTVFEKNDEEAKYKTIKMSKFDSMVYIILINFFNQYML